ncbi:hypothetical protein EDWATA_00784 [Edwardsiella tarda ATCC 23685]|uniref:Uncharacterized protein n=1 Tax=Edwardsiella tarda ATCC 23685 TaxID=500638 RepID=D4F240_EDWTA|nr:hypothetical protein EDWATA_00784 [Edwardsiella tarda ATCC 23685]
MFLSLDTSKRRRRNNLSFWFYPILQNNLLSISRSMRRLTTAMC